MLPEDKWYIALPVCALIFAMLHIYHSLYYVLGAVAIALVTGVLYHRQKNVWSSFTRHFCWRFSPGASGSNRLLQKPSAYSCAGGFRHEEKGGLRPPFL